jgi:general secretion pathway protein J
MAVEVMRRRTTDVASSHPRGPARGFTLVELIIALALIGLITLLLFSGLKLGSSVWEGVQTLGERVGGPRLTLGFLTRTLAQARPAQVVFDGEKRLVFDGDQENLEFVAPLSEHVGTPGLYVLRLTLEEGKSNRLVLTRWLLHPDVLAGLGDIPEWEPLTSGAHALVGVDLEEDRAAGAFGSTLLLDAVEELEIGYFGIAQGEQEPGWHEEWLPGSGMPEAVRIHLTTRGQGWPDMLVRLPQVAEAATGAPQ